MKLNKKLIDKFNQPDTVLVISGYPERKDNKNTTHGIAWYTKNRLLEQADKFGTRFVVLVEKGEDNRPRLDGAGKILVLRIFDKKKPRLFPQILKWLIKFSKIKKAVVHSEFCANGRARNFFLLLPFLALIRLFDKRIVYFAHNVVDDFGPIARHLGLSNWQIGLYNWGIKYYYLGLGLMVDNIVVLSQELLKRINKFVERQKLAYIPIGVELNRENVGKRQARKLLGLSNNEKVILYFGFVSWYKGADWLVRGFDKLSKQKQYGRVRLILAGGQAYSLKQQEYYQRYYQALRLKAEENSRIDLTGFVAGDKAGLYFQAADLVVLPYRGLIGASGCLALALSFQKPILVSRHLIKALELVDEKEKMVFSLSQQGMQQVMTSVLSHKKLIQLKILSGKLIRASRTERVVEREYEEIYQTGVGVRAGRLDTGKVDLALVK